MKDILDTYQENLAAKRRRVDAGGEAQEKRLNLCVEHVLAFIENRVEDIDSVAFPDQFYFLWFPQNWLFLHKEEIEKHFETGEPMVTTNFKPPADENELLGKIAQRLMMLHHHIHAEHADGGHTPALVIKLAHGNRPQF